MDIDFTPREREIIRLVLVPMNNQEIAKELDISRGSVKKHLEHIYEKLGIHNRVQFVLWAERNKIVEFLE